MLVVLRNTLYMPLYVLDSDTEYRSAMVDMDAKLGVETEGAEAGKQVRHKPRSLKNLGSPVPR